MADSNMDAVHKAVMRHSLPELIGAIAQGARVDSPDREGRTPLFYAAQEGDLSIVEELVRRGVNVNSQDRNLKTPLHFAALAYQLLVADLLLRNGAAVDARDANGNTPLSDAVFESRGRGQMIELLLSYGADRTLANRYGVSPKSLARSIANWNVSCFLED